MLKVISNGGIGVIKRQIFLSLGLFFSCSQLGAMSCPQTVGAISMTEGIFNVLSRVAEAQNVIQSQICAIDCGVTVTTLVVTVTGSSSVCDCIQFGQSDIGAGGVYTISSPGVYCMYDDANFTTGVAIIVTSSNVTIDMQEHTLNGGAHAGTTGIVINGGLSNVTIKNGNIDNITVAGIANNNANLLSLQDIAIQNMSFNIVGGTTSYPAVLFQTTAPSDPFFAFDNVLIENCTGYNTYISLSAGQVVVMLGCEFACGLNSGNASIDITGPTAASGVFMQSAIIEDCIIGNESIATPGGTASFNLQSISSLIIRNCASYGSATAAFNLNSVTNGTIYNCEAQQCTSEGFSIVPANDATPMNVSLTNCVAQDCSYGFYINSLNPYPILSSVILNNCVAQNNTEYGIYAKNVGPSLISFACRNCTADGNNSGFGIGLSGNEIGDGVLLNCTASDNASHGFVIGTTVSHLSVVGCNAVSNGGNGYAIGGTHCYFESYALANSDYGFEDYTASGNSTNYYFGCRSLNNGSGAYFSTASAFPNVVTYGGGSTYGLNLEG